MKETELFTADKVAIHKQNIIKAANEHHIGTIRPHSGHTLFEINAVSGDIAPAEFEVSTAVYSANSKGLVRRKIVIKANCVYISALNKKNAIKQLLRQRTPAADVDEIDCMAQPEI